jgi:hypothetical protein
MKAEKKRLGVSRIERAKRKTKNLAETIFLVLISTLIILSVYFGYQLLNSPQYGNGLPEPTQRFMPDEPNPNLKAAIVDQLSLTIPNETFKQEAAAILTKANYIVDYYSGEKVTVNFYRNLPTGNYKLIILRVHSTATGSQGKKEPVVLFTSERYDDSKYTYEQLTDQLYPVEFTYDKEKGIKYFGITPLFISKGVNGNFQNAVIIMMGCQGLENTLMAQAFIQKGAKVYISWNQWVTATHTDIATTRLLQHFLIEKLTVKKAIQETYKDIGADPVYKSLLIAYPIEALNYTIDDIQK